MSLRPVLAFLSLPCLLGCAQPDEAAYPRLLPLSELNRAPAIPAHAADAAADPQAVAEGLASRRTAADARAAEARRPVTDAAALEDRAAGLRRRADALARTDLPTGEQPAADAPSADRARALRERARALERQPVGALPPCPAGTPDPAAARCAVPTNP